MGRPPKLPDGILKWIGPHLKWADEPFEAGSKKLKPNVYYTTGKSSKTKYVYTTDAQGRIKTAHAHPLKLSDTKRAKHDAKSPGKLKGDDAGHLLADRFDGSPKLDNIVSQERRINQVEYKRLEDSWAEGLNKTPPDEIFVDVEVHYGSGERPTGFTVHQTINGVEQDPVRFKNPKPKP